MAISKPFVSLVALAALGASPAHAATFIFAGNLSGSQEVPPVSSPGIGTALAILDDVTNQLSVQVTFANLIGTTTMAHIHCCAPIGANAGVATPVPNFPGFPLGVTAGSYSTILDLTQASSFNPAFITNNGGTVASARAALITGLQTNRAYFNIIHYLPRWRNPGAAAQRSARAGDMDYDAAGLRRNRSDDAAAQGNCTVGYAF
jgi:hypothetical protein